jgi:cobalamin-dependent methionine synthase I
VDGTLDVIVARKNEALRRTGQALTKRRFSPGYGDLDLKFQKVFYDLLSMQTLDVTINENYLLSPAKSVIAIAGVE